MDRQIRLFTPEDYPIVKEWWAGHDWEGVPLDVLPSLGAIASVAGEDVCAAWLYMDNSVGVCMLEWLVANPESSGKKILVAERMLQNFLEEEAKEMDYGVMLTTCKQESLARLHEKNGFMRTDSNMIHLIKFLKLEEID
jgi:hypothetical protein